MRAKPLPDIRECDHFWWTRLSWEKDGACLLWPRYTDPKTGYGKLSFRGAYVLAHRLAFVMHHRPLKAGEIVVQTCGNRSCCAPKHLEAMSPGDAARRRLA